MADEIAAPQIETAGTLSEGAAAAEESFSLGEVFKAEGEGQQQQQKPAEGQQQQQTQQPAAPVAPTADEISAKVLAGLQPQGQPAKQYSREELDKMFNVYQPQMDLVQAIREGDEAAALKAMGDLRDGLVKQMNTLTQYQLRILREDLMQELNPALSAATRTEAARQESEFYDSNKDLAAHKKAVSTVFRAMKAEGVNFKSRDEASKALADRTRELLGLASPNGSNGSGTGQPSGSQQQQQAGARPAALSAGSGAAAGGGASASSGNVIADVFA